MKAVIPVATKKESLFPFSESRPVGLMPVNGKSLVKHTIMKLQEVGVDDIYLVTNYLEEQFEEVFEQYTNVNLVRQEELNGTAGAVDCCSFIQEDFFVVNGDVMVSGEDLKKLLKKHRETENSTTMLLTDQKKPEKFGVVSITDDRVEAIEEKPEKAENPLINTGIYIFGPEIFDSIENLGGERMDLTEAVSDMVQKKGARFELIEDYWFDIGMPKTLWKADRVKRANLSAEVSEKAVISENAFVDESSTVEKGAEIKSGAVVENGSYVGENAVIGPGAIVRDSTVGKSGFIEGSSVVSSLLFENTIVKPNVAVKQCIIGEETEINQGTVVKESFIGPRSFIEMNNSILDVTFVPDARTDLGEISK